MALVLHKIFVVTIKMTVFASLEGVYLARNMEGLVKSHGTRCEDVVPSKVASKSRSRVRVKIGSDLIPGPATLRCLEWPYLNASGSFKRPATKAIDEHVSPKDCPEELDGNGQDVLLPVLHFG
ncbi:hypothetical protein EV421DRAFT_1742294 [Armillaria borealis]|uniref:Uncharacterized protein n=1 Tax=Armillaria borealis TaxID=47425 RepID=A0AA39IXS0_9AGAR|nr:hypothetical protein EV421DRAFT_1742294 [Armillaria borealis]